MYLNDIQRSGFYESLGLDAREYDIHVIRKTNETAGRVFPLVLDVDQPEFFERLDICTQNTEKLVAISNSNAPKPLQFLQKLPVYASTATQLIRLYFLKPIDTLSMEGSIR
jgi:magnesium-protoporphyrin IX monomethyl ester (oxidative) cyclase